MLYPTNQVADTSDGEGGAQAGIETGKEFNGNKRKVFQANTETHHAEDEDIAVPVEESKERFLALREIEDACGVSLDETVEHQREADRHDCRRQA